MDVKKRNGAREIEEDISHIAFFLYATCLETKIMEMRNRRWSCLKLENEEDIKFHRVNLPCNLLRKVLLHCKLQQELLSQTAQ